MINSICLAFLYLAASCNNIHPVSDKMLKEGANADALICNQLEVTPKSPQKHRYHDREILIKFKQGTAHENIRAIQEKLDIETISVNVTLNVYRMKIKSCASVEEIIKSLKNFKEVEYSEPNYFYDIQ